MRRLLLLSCSERKHSGGGYLPARERYDGVSFRVLKKLEREHAFPKDLDVLILSAKYGLIPAETLIGYYDQKMTRKRATVLAPSVSEKLDSVLRQKKYSEIFINLGKHYLVALQLSHELPKHYVRYAAGGIGSRMKQMKQWILLA
ncbi:MAG: DUF6884 domain-containing protein [Candidatus Thermochlorobacter sp.]